MERIDVSICIASYRRPEGLARLLGSLVRLKLPPELRFEVVVVDNDASGSAAPLLARYAESLPLRSAVEPERNIACARNRALELARGDWIATLDDDESVCEDWLAAYWERASEGDADGWFGPVIPRYEGEPGRVARALAVRPSPASDARLGLDELRTGNAFLRRRWFDGRRFDPAFGRSGGEDTELFARCLRAGADFRWCAAAAVTEQVPRERQSLRYFALRALRGGHVATRIAQRNRPGTRRDFERALRACAALPLCLAAAVLTAVADRVRAARWLLRACVQLGHLRALAGRGLDAYRRARLPDSTIR